MFTEGLKLMVAGMSTVFIFLTLMLVIISGLSKLLAPFAYLLEDTKNTTVTGKENKDTNNKAEDNKALVSAIVVAVNKYRKTRKN